VSRRLRWSLLGAGSCAAVALVATLLTSPADQPVRAHIIVPQAADSGPEPPRRPQSTVSILLPSAPIDPPRSSAAPVGPERRAPAAAPQALAPPATPASVDLQAEDATIRYGKVDSDYAGFTGSGFVNYDSVAGGSVEWTVTAPAARAADVVFRFTNGSSAARPMLISVDGTPAGVVGFPVTYGWADWRTLTVHVNLPAGTSTIRATATNKEGGPNVDKITLM
jgi:hypothetical protein